MSEARTPPHNLEAERSALGAVLLVPDCLDDLAVLDVDELFLPAHREILEAMRSVVQRGRPPDLVMVADELKARGLLSRMEDGEGYLMKLAHEACLRDVLAHYVRVIAGHALSRRILARCAETISCVYGGAASDEILGEHRRAIGELEVKGAGGPVRVGDDLDQVIRDMDARGRAPDEHLVPTGIVRVDNKIGGLRGGHFIVIAANPGRGKTALAWNIVQRAAEKAIPCLVFSLEMSRPEMIERAIAYHGRVDGRAVSLGRLTYLDWKKIEGKLAHLHGLPIWLDDRSLTTSALCAEARRWRARHPDPRALIVIDYIGLVSPDLEERTREREVSKMSRAFKQLAKQCAAPVVICAQLNRDNVGKDAKMRKPVLRDLRDSGAIEQDADMVIFPWWDREPPARGRHPGTLIVAKYRGGPKGDIPVIWEPEFMAFSDRTDEDERDDESQLALAPSEFDT